MLLEQLISRFLNKQKKIVVMKKILKIKSHWMKQKFFLNYYRRQQRKDSVKYEDFSL